MGAVMGVHSPTPGGSRSKWTQVPSAAGQEGSPHCSARQRRRQVRVAAPTQVKPWAQTVGGAQGSPRPARLLGEQATLPVGSTILHSRAGSSAQDSGSKTSQLFTG